MVSTRSGRVVSAETTSFGRFTRSRARKDADNPQEEEAVEYGQPEVTSPALPANYFASEAVAPSPAPFGGFGSPLGPGYIASTPMQPDSLGTPFQERLVKTVGKSAAKTPAARTPSVAAATAAVAATPSAMDVQRAAFLPLPDDAPSNETEPFASSEDEPVGPASPEKEQAAATRSFQAEERPARRKGLNLLAVFAFISITVTAVIALLLSPCMDQAQYAAMNSRSYERVCKSLVRIGTGATDRTQLLHALVADRVGLLHKDLPPAAAEALDQGWASVKQAHVAFWTAASPLVAKARGHAAPLWELAQPKLRRAQKVVVAHTVPLLERVLELALSAQSRPQPTPVPISCIAFDDFLAVLDRTSVRPEYLRELWDKAARDVATKQKATVWLLSCGNDAECSAAAGGLLAAATGYIEIDGGSYWGANVAGQLQRQLVTFLRAYPDGLVLVARPEKLHPNSLAVLANAASEGGHLQMDGRPVATKRALFVFLVEYQGAAADAGGERGSEEDAAVKSWLVQSISALGSDAEHTAGVVRSFRRRVDAVLPVRKVPAVGIRSVPKPAPMSDQDSGMTEAALAAEGVATTTETTAPN